MKTIPKPWRSLREISMAKGPLNVSAKSKMRMDNGHAVAVVGADRGRRELTVRNVGGREVLVDSDGRPAGVLVEAAPE